MPNSARSVADLARNMLVLVALLTMGISFIVQLSHDRADSSVERQLTCSRIYQDTINQASSDASTALSELVVIIAATAPDREQLITDKVVTLKAANAAVRVAVARKAAWNHDLNPLPCPVTAP